MRAQTRPATTVQGSEGPTRRDDVSEVLFAGARARAVADACEANGLAAVLLDRAGRVLHVGPKATALLGGALRVEADHLIGRDAAANDAVAAVLNPVLSCDRGTGARGEAAPVAEAGDLLIAATGYADPSPYQLLRAVVLLGRGRAAIDDGVRSLRGL